MSPPLRIESVVVTGGRHFTDSERIATDIRHLRSVGLVRLAHGDAKGADAIADAEVRGILPIARYVADFKRHGPSAGPRRNIAMLRTERPAVVLAYPDENSRGTWHCLAYALTIGAAVILWAPHVEIDVFAGDESSEAAVFIETSIAGRKAGMHSRPGQILRLPATVHVFDDGAEGGTAGRFALWNTTGDYSADADREQLAHRCLGLLGGCA